MPVPARVGRGPKLLAGGQTLLPTMKQRLASPVGPHRSERHRRTWRDQHGRRAIVIGAMTRHAEVAASRGGAGRRSRRSPTWPSGIGDPQVRNRGTIGGSVANADPAADYPGGGGRAERHGAHQQARDRRRRLLHGPVRDGPGRRRDHHQGELPDPGEGGLHEVPQPGLALRHRRRVRGARAATACGWRSPVPAGSVFRVPEMEPALGELHAEAVAGIAVPDDGLNSDIHASAEYRAHLVTVMARRAATAGWRARAGRGGGSARHAPCPWHMNGPPALPSTPPRPCSPAATTSPTAASPRRCSCR